MKNKSIDFAVSGIVFSCFLVLISKAKPLTDYDERAFELLVFLLPLSVASIIVRVYFPEFTRKSVKLTHDFFSTILFVCSSVGMISVVYFLVMSVNRDFGRTFLTVSILCYLGTNFLIKLLNIFESKVSDKGG
jgi:hypothetical protein